MKKLMTHFLILTPALLSLSIANAITPQEIRKGMTRNKVKETDLFTLGGKPLTKANATTHARKKFLQHNENLKKEEGKYYEASPENQKLELQAEHLEKLIYEKHNPPKHPPIKPVSGGEWGALGNAPVPDHAPHLPAIQRVSGQKDWGLPENNPTAPQKPVGPAAAH